jgi:hypothetical protein
MRLNCEFGDCLCSKCIGSPKCRRCGHGECWHKRSVQFDSPRVSARRGQYVKVPIVHGVFIPMAPPVSPLESEDSDNYCSHSVALPV